MGQPAPHDRVTIQVRETLGLRRFGYPVTVSVPLPSGAVREAQQVILEQEGHLLRGVQVDVRSRWPDGSLQWLWLAFNTSPGPFEVQNLVLRFGPDVARPDPGAGVVRENADSFVLRDVYRFPRTGPHFLTSIRYGTREFLSAPARWFWKEQPDAPEEALEIRQGRLVSAGPIHAAVELTGSVGRRNVPFRLMVTQPNSKSWFDATLELPNPGGSDGQLGLVVPYAMERRPVLYDFGAGSWIYGQLRDGGRAILRIARGGAWNLLAPPATAASPMQEYAASGPRQARAEGWAHLIDGSQAGRAIAFGSPSFADSHRPYTGEIEVGADGATRMVWHAGKRSRLTVQALYHHVSDPIHVSAATSPPAMLYPLATAIPAEWIETCRAGRKSPIFP